MRSTLRRACLAAIVLLLGALAIAGCGPGLGGTGTGAAAFDAFGASPAPVCGGAVAAALSCASAPAGPPPSGTLPVQFSDAAGQVVLELNGNFARLDDSCLKLSFSGEFGSTAGGAQGFFGSYQVDSDGHDVLAALSTVPTGGGRALTVELQDVAARVVVGPVLLRRTTVPLLAPNPC
jgi:hypothetical protein